MTRGKDRDGDRGGRAGVSRRAVLVSAVAGGALFYFAPSRAVAQSRPEGTAGAAPQPSAPHELTCWIEIKPDETIVIRLARAEIGQGAFTALPLLVAEELECDWARVSVEIVSPTDNQRRRLIWQERLLKGAPSGEALLSHWGAMATDAGSSTALSQLYLRRAGATARVMLVEAAAKNWNVSAFDCTVAAGVISHGASGRKTSYGKVAAAAARLPPPLDVPLKDAKTWRLAAKSNRQLDTRGKVDGSLQYAIDVRLPQMLHAVVARCPVFGGKLAGFEPVEVEQRAGVRHVLRLDEATVCVVAESFWQAKTGLEALPVTWDEGPGATATSAAIADAQRAGLETAEAPVAAVSGDAPAALQAAAKVVEADYATPYLDHAALEPMNCTAWLHDGGLELWLGTHAPEGALAVAAAAAQLDPDRVRVHLRHSGGSFGRRGAPHDVVRLAVLAARRTAGRPVQLVYTREEDMTHGFYRPATHARLRAALDDKGVVTGLRVRVAGQSIDAWHRPRAIAGNLDPMLVQGFMPEDFGYGIANLKVEAAMRNSVVPPGRWRSAYYSQNVFYRECFIDEIALAAGKDPLEFRKSLMAKGTRQLRVLDLAAEKAGWTVAPAKGIGRGIALQLAFGSAQATVAEVSVDAEGKLRVHRIVNALDCGHVVNPNSIDQQMSGGTIMAISALMYGAITIDKGRVVERNFDSYPLLRMAEVPSIENHILGSIDGWGAVGEATLPSVAPAICNAIFAATGVRIRTLPLKNQKLTPT